MGMSGSDTQSVGCVMSEPEAPVEDGSPRSRGDWEQLLIESEICDVAEPRVTPWSATGPRRH